MCKDTILQLKNNKLSICDFIRWYEEISESEKAKIYSSLIKELEKNLSNMNCIMCLASIKINTDKIDEKVIALINGKMNPHQFRYWAEYSAKTYWYIKQKLVKYSKNANCLTCLAYLQILKEDPRKVLENKEIINLFQKAIELGNIAAISLYCEYKLANNNYIFDSKTRELCIEAAEKGDQLAPYLLGVYKTIDDENMIQIAIERREPLAMIYVANRYAKQKGGEEKAVSFYLQAYQHEYKFEDLPQLRLLLSEMCKIVNSNINKIAYQDFLVQIVTHLLYNMV